MGLSAGFKNYLSDVFPTTIAKNSAPAVADVMIVDAMVTLHGFRVDPTSPYPAGRQLADKFYFMIWNSPIGVVCFDDVHDTTRAKEQEWSARGKTACVCDPAALEELLEKHELPSDWDDFVRDRVGRQRMNTYVRDELFKRMRISRGLTEMQRLLVFNAGDGPPTEGVWPAEQAEAPFCPDELVVRSRTDWATTLVGEGETACVRAATLLRDGLRVDTRVIISTCDTDAVLIAMLNSFPGLLVELSHYDRKAGALSYALVDTHALTTAVETRLRVTRHDFALIALSKGSDFVSQSVAGIADWSKYVLACCSHIQLTSPIMTVEASKATVDVARVDGMLRSLGTMGKRVLPKYEGANHLKRLIWNTLYFSYGAGGLASGALKNLESYGWCVKDGVMCADDTPVAIKSAHVIDFKAC
jgi:hypothetical protein